MKKTIVFILTMAMAAVSCNKEGAVEAENKIPASGRLTATFVQTKATYTETQDINLQPAWEVGDKIIGFDEANNTYTLAVTSVSAQTATLEGNVPDGDLHLIYKSGASASDIIDGTLTVNYTSQAGDKTIPAVMLADGTVKNGSGNFVFSNAGSIIGISALKGISPGNPITNITVEGENLSKATVALKGASLALTAKTKSSDSASAGLLSDIVVTDEYGTLSAPVFIAVPSGAKVSRVCVNDCFSYELPSVRDVEAGQYLYIKEQTFSEIMVEYCVQYIDINNNKLADDKVVTCPLGTTIIEYALPISGFKPFQESIEQDITDKGKVFIFVYFEFDKPDIW